MRAKHVFYQLSYTIPPTVAELLYRELLVFNTPHKEKCPGLGLCMLL